MYCILEGGLLVAETFGLVEFVRELTEAALISRADPPDGFEGIALDSDLSVLLVPAEDMGAFVEMETETDVDKSFEDLKVFLGTETDVDEFFGGLEFLLEPAANFDGSSIASASGFACFF